MQSHGAQQQQQVNTSPPPSSLSSSTAAATTAAAGEDRTNRFSSAVHAGQTHPESTSATQTHPHAPHGRAASQPPRATFDRPASFSPTISSRSPWSQSGSSQRLLSPTAASGHTGGSAAGVGGPGGGIGAVGIPMPQTRSSSFSGGPHSFGGLGSSASTSSSYFASVMRERSFASTFEDDESEFEGDVVGRVGSGGVVGGDPYDTYDADDYDTGSPFVGRLSASASSARGDPYDEYSGAEAYSTGLRTGGGGGRLPPSLSSSLSPSQLPNPMRGRTYAPDLSRSRSQSLATATVARPLPIGSPFGTTSHGYSRDTSGLGSTMASWNGNELGRGEGSYLGMPIGGGRYGEIKPPGRQDTTNQSPFLRDVGQILLDDGSAFRELWGSRGSNTNVGLQSSLSRGDRERDREMEREREREKAGVYAALSAGLGGGDRMGGMGGIGGMGLGGGVGGGGSGTTSRRHSVSVVQPRRGRGLYDGIEGYEYEYDERERIPGGGGVGGGGGSGGGGGGGGTGTGSLMLSDEDLALAGGDMNLPFGLERNFGMMRLGKAQFQGQQGQGQGGTPGTPGTPGTAGQQSQPSSLPVYAPLSSKSQSSQTMGMGMGGGIGVGVGMGMGVSPGQGTPLGGGGGLNIPGGVGAKRSSSSSPSEGGRSGHSAGGASGGGETSGSSTSSHGVVQRDGEQVQMAQQQQQQQHRFPSQPQQIQTQGLNGTSYAARARAVSGAGGGGMSPVSPTTLRGMGYYGASQQQQQQQQQQMFMRGAAPQQGPMHGLPMASGKRPSNANASEVMGMMGAGVGLGGMEAGMGIGHAHGVHPHAHPHAAHPHAHPQAHAHPHAHGHTPGQGHGQHGHGHGMAHHAPPPATPTSAGGAAPEHALGKGLPLSAVPLTWRLYIVEFKAGRTDLFYLTDTVRGEILRAEGISQAQNGHGYTNGHGAGAGVGGEELSPIHVGDLVIVEADRGRDLGRVVNDSITVGEVEAWLERRESDAGGGASSAGWDESMSPLSPTAGAGGVPPTPTTAGGKKEINPKQIYGKAGPQEAAMLSAKMSDEVKALQLCQSKVRAKKLPMEVVDAEYQWDRRKLTFYFVAEKRIDFRELVRELFRLYKTRIWMASLQGGGGFEQ